MTLHCLDEFSAPIYHVDVLEEADQRGYQKFCPSL